MLNFTCGIAVAVIVAATPADEGRRSPYFVDEAQVERYLELLGLASEADEESGNLEGEAMVRAVFTQHTQRLRELTAALEPSGAKLMEYERQYRAAYERLKQVVQEHGEESAEAIEIQEQAREISAASSALMRKHQQMLVSVPRGILTIESQLWNELEGLSDPVRWRAFCQTRRRDITLHLIQLKTGRADLLEQVRRITGCDQAAPAWNEDRVAAHAALLDDYFQRRLWQNVVLVESALGGGERASEAARAQRLDRSNRLALEALRSDIAIARANVEFLRHVLPDLPRPARVVALHDICFATIGIAARDVVSPARPRCAALETDELAAEQLEAAYWSVLNAFLAWEEADHGIGYALVTNEERNQRWHRLKTSIGRIDTLVQGLQQPHEAAEGSK